MPPQAANRRKMPLSGSQTKRQEPEHGPTQAGVATPHEWGSGTALEHRLEHGAEAWPGHSLPREHKHLWHLSTCRHHPL